MTDTSKAEEWRPVSGFESVFEISSIGRLRRIVAETQADSVGYRTASIRVGDKYRRTRIHCLVAENFIGKPTEKGPWEVNHKDGNKLNNHVSNLEYLRPSQNNNHATKHGLNRKRCALDEAKVVEIRRHISKGVPDREIGKLFGVSRGCIQSIRTNKTWTWL